MTDTSWIKPGAAAVFLTRTGKRLPCVIEQMPERRWILFGLYASVVFLERHTETRETRLHSKLVAVSRLRPRFPAEEAEIDRLIPNPADAEKGA